MGGQIAMRTASFVAASRRFARKYLKLVLTPAARFVSCRPILQRRVLLLLHIFPKIEIRVYNLFHEHVNSTPDQFSTLGALPSRGMRF